MKNPIKILSTILIFLCFISVIHKSNAETEKYTGLIPLPEPMEITESASPTLNDGELKIHCLKVN